MWDYLAYSVNSDIPGADIILVIKPHRQIRIKNFSWNKMSTGIFVGAGLTLYYNLFIC